MSLGILRVAACLEQQGYGVQVLDLSGISNYTDALADHAASTGAVIFGITATTPQMPAVNKILEVLRKTRPDARVILGGPHITLVNAAYKRERKLGMNGRATRALNKLLGQFDVLVAGDGEEAIFLAISHKATQLIDADDPASAMFLTNSRLNELPWPARHLVDMKSYHYSIDGIGPAYSLIGQLGCPYASLTGDTFVFTDLGFQRLDSLVSGHGTSEICQHGSLTTSYPLDIGLSTHTCHAIASAIIDEGIRQTFMVQTENGLRVNATAGHKFLVYRGQETVWVAVSDLRLGDWMVLQTPHHNWPISEVQLPKPPLPDIPPGGFPRKHTDTPSTLNADIAWLTGFILGDGCIPSDGRPTIHVCVFDWNQDRLCKIAKEQFGTSLSITNASNTTKMRHGWLHSRAARSFFVECIGINPLDKLHVPDVIRRSPRHIIESFLEGLHDADGYLASNSKHLEMSTVSEQFANEIACLITMLDGIPNIQPIVLKHRDDSISYRVGRFHNDRIPTSMAIYRSSKSGDHFWRKPRNREAFLGVRRRTLTASGLKHPLDIPGRHYVRLESITPNGEQRVYDLHVPKDHSFISNGLVSHNCNFCGGRLSPMLRRVRMRSVDNILGEVEHLWREYGSRATMFYDDETNVNPKMVELMNGIAGLSDKLGVEFRLRGFIKSQLFTDEQASVMYRAGFRWILVGYESGSERILENINKKATRAENTRCMEIAKRNGLKVKALMSIGHAGESAETVEQTKQWLLEVQPEDFDCTVISTYPGTPYYDEAIQSKDNSDVWTYTAPKSRDRLHSMEVDYAEEAQYYKGKVGEYVSYVHTDALTGAELVKLRDDLENDVRAKLGIPFNQSAAAINYEHSMGQSGRLPPHILRESCA